MSAKAEFQNERTRKLIKYIPSETQDHLMDRFWTCYNSVIHVLHMDAFEINRNNEDICHYSPFLHICVLDRESLLYKEAKKHVEHEFKMYGGIPSLQALLLLGDLECGIGKYNNGWMYAGQLLESLSTKQSLGCRHV